MSRAPHCLSHGLSNEGNDSCEIMPAHEKFVWEYLGQSSVFIGKENNGGRRMVDWERRGGWWTGNTGSGMKETQKGGGTRTSRPTGCIGILLKEDHFMT